MPDRFIVPNLHVVLVHYPIALLTLGVLIELFSFLWRQSGFRTAGRWMIAIGALSSFPVALSGIYALVDVARSNNPQPHGSWEMVRAGSPVLSDPDTWRVLKRHVLLESISAGLCGLAVVMWIGSSDRTRRSLHWPLLVILLGGVGLMVAGAWNAGEAIYRHGAAVTVIAPQRGVDARPDGGGEPRSKPPAWEKYAPPMEDHVLGAGSAIALALTAMALAWRKVNATYDVQNTRPITARDETMGGHPVRTPPDPVAMVRTFNPKMEMEIQPFAPAGRFWLLTFLLAAMTLCVGLYMTADLGKTNSVIVRAKDKHVSPAKQFWNEIRPDAEHGERINRDTVHFFTGSSIVILPLLLAVIARLAPRRRFMLSFFSGLLLLAIATQVWIGILILYDSEAGPVTRFNHESASELPATKPTTELAIPQPG